MDTLESARMPVFHAALLKPKQEWLALVEVCCERAAIAEYCGRLPRATAESLAWQCVLGEIPAQPCIASVPGHEKTTA